MGENFLTVNLAIENGKTLVPYTNTTTAEDVCVQICKQLRVGPLARHLFALRVTGEHNSLMPNSNFQGNQNELDLRIRFKMADINKLKKFDKNAYDYYFHQARADILANKIPDLSYDKFSTELMGLGITDMYRVMLEKGLSRENVQNDYKKYVPKDALKKHSFFIKKPIRENLMRLEKLSKIRTLDVFFVKAQYINQLDLIAPEYLSETYTATTDLDGNRAVIVIKVTPPHVSEPGIKYCLEAKKDQWTLMCTIEELGFIAIRNDGGIEISRFNGIPIYLKFNSKATMWSFVTLLDGYYRLTCKWTFNLCQDLETPSLRRLHYMKCHGPVGGEFSYAKLEAKTSNKCGSFIVRESETDYNVYYIDVCLRDSAKPKTFKLQRIKEDEFLFHEDVRPYKNVSELMKTYSDPDGAIYLKECVPPSEYDMSPLLLCRSDNVVGDALTDSSSLPQLIPEGPVCINYKDLQVYKDRKSSGPWCYTMNSDLLDETCSVPLCSYSECRLTGPGMEYGGGLDKGVSDRRCLKWNKDRKKVLVKGNFTKYERFPESRFPENSLAKAAKFCRNPDGDLGGPWCFVENEVQGHIEREYCDVPFCFEPECSVFTKNHDTYMHYTDFNGSALTDIKFSLKAWDSDSASEASARLVLSVLALPLSGKEIGDLGIGIELFISNKESGLRYGNKDRPDFEPTPGLISSTNFTTFTLNWDRGFITFGVEGRLKPIFLAEIKTKNNLMGFQKDKFDFYSAQGTNVIWNFPFCLDDEECDVHTTTGSQFQQFWPLRQKSIVYDLHVHLRAFHSAAILMTPSPTVDFPNLKIVFLGPNGFTKFTLKEHRGASEVVLKELQLEGVVDYWSWNEFSISFFANSLQIYTKKPVGMHSLLESTNELFRQMRWFSVSSDNTVAHWSFFCQPPHFAQPPLAVLPDCAINTNEPDYTGTQDITGSGLPCLPWSGGKLLPDDMLDLFKNESAILGAKNYCRDPALKGEGTYCYALTQSSEKRAIRQPCRLRKCRSQQCKMAGTGNDFIGQLAVTRSGRSCDTWDSSSDSVHPEHMFAFNNSYFAEMNSKDAKNFCRNPNRDISGSWCYTKDPKVVQDVCDVRDCDRPEELIVITSSTNSGRRIYILPQWKEEGLHGGLRFSLKQWNPDLLNGIGFAVTSKDGKSEIRLFIGASFNEKLELYVQGTLIESKTYPHLISAGIWTDFWLQIRMGEIMLGFKGVPTPLFEWRQPDSDAFEPMFLSYFSLYEHMPMAVFFQPGECHTEVTTDSDFLQYVPIGIFSEQEKVAHANLTIKMRGAGLIWISLMWVPINLSSYQIKIDTKEETIAFHRTEPSPRGTEPHITLLAEKQVRHLLAEDKWTKFNFAWSETVFDIKWNDELVLRYENDRPLLLYWFSVAAAEGTATWSANCEPLDLDGPPIDGGWSEWSPWTCSVTCGGGEGFRTRTCSNPRPNILGRLCQGSPTATGLCNDFPCGDLSFETLELIRRRLRAQAHSLLADEDSPVLIPNDLELIKIVKKESPEAYFEWTLNGMLIDANDRVTFERHDLRIKKAKPSDAGVYVFMIYRVNNRRAVMRVATLAVKAKSFDVDTRATLSYTLQCHSVVLGYVYADLSLKLLVNNRTYLDYGLTTLAAVSTRELAPLNVSNSGAWQCVVEQKGLKLRWVTNYVRMNVKVRPSFYTHLMEDRLTAPLFGGLKAKGAVLGALLALTLAVFLLVSASTVLYMKFCTLKSRRNRRP